MKDLFKKIPKALIFFLVILIPYLFISQTDSSYFSYFKSMSLAAVPMSWGLDKIRSQISQSEKKYEEAYLNGSNPNGNFMKKQEAAMAGMRARQYDLESEQSLGYSLNTYNPNDYTSGNFISDGRPTPIIQYEPSVSNNSTNIPTNNSSTNNNQTNSNSNTTNNDTGLANDQNVASQTGQDVPLSQQKHHQGDPWGGLVTSRISCTCEIPNYIVVINDYVIKSQRVLKVDYQKTGFYLFYDLKPGQHGLGTFDKNAICKMLVGPICIDFPVDGVINKGPGFGSSGVMGSGGFPSLSDTPTGPSNVTTF